MPCAEGELKCQMAIGSIAKRYFENRRTDVHGRTQLDPVEDTINSRELIADPSNSQWGIGTAALRSANCHGRTSKFRSKWEPRP